VLVLTNGIGMIDASALSPDHQVAGDPSEAERIEVLRGPAALAYGGSAIGGVVNVIDNRVPRAMPDSGIAARISASGTSVNEGYSLNGAATFGTGPLVFSFDGVTREAGDYDIPGFAESKYQMALEEEEHDDEDEDEHDDEDHEEEEPAHGTVPNSDLSLTTMGGGVSYIGSGGFVGFSLKSTRTNYGVPGHAHGHEEEEHEDEHEDEDDHEDEEEHEHGEEEVSIDLEQLRFDLHAEQEIGFGPFSLLRFAGGYADYEHVEFEGEEVGTRFFSDGYEARLELVQEEANGWQGAVGLQNLKRNFDAEGAEAYVPKTEIREIGAFTLQRYDEGNWGIEGGLRLDNRALDSVAGERDFTNFSASAGAFLRPMEPWFLGLSIARTARAPREEELFANGPHVATRGFEIGDSSLSSEIAYSADGSIHYDGDPFSADIHAFIAHYDGFIDAVPTGDVEDDLNVFRYTQTSADFYGFELELGMRIWQEGARSVRLEAVADYVHGDTGNGPPARIPPYSLTGRIVHDAPRWSAEFEVRHVGGQDRLAAFELPTDSYTMLNASLRFRPLMDDAITLFVAADNITDVEAREHVSFLKDLAPLPGRSFRVGMIFRR
jgi:iron complex outermembrane receptor protein